MTIARILAGATLLVGATMFAPGCITGALEAYHGFKGADYGYEEIQPVAPSKADMPLGVYGRFELGTFTDDMGGRVPVDFFSYLPSEFQTALAKWKLPNAPAGKTLLVRGRVVHYESQSLGAVLLTPLEEVVARVELVDKSSGKVLGVANCIGRSEARTTMGDQRMAEGMGRALANWIGSRYPKSDR